MNLKANVAQVVESMGGRGGQVTVNGDPSINALGDPARFRQIVRNLLSNALSHGGEPYTVEISASEDRAILTVRDGGPGVPTALVDSIFDQYVSGNDDGESPGRVGIGLWISRELANLMGGQISYHREQGETRFRVSIPRFQREAG